MCVAAALQISQSVAHHILAFLLRKHPLSFLTSQALTLQALPIYWPRSPLCSHGWPAHGLTFPCDRPIARSDFTKKLVPLGEREVRGIIWVCLLSHHKDKCFAPSPGNFISSAEKVISSCYPSRECKEDIEKGARRRRHKSSEIFEHAPPSKN